MTVASVLALGPKQQVAAVRVKILPGRALSRIVQVDGVARELRRYHVCDRSGQGYLVGGEDKEESRSYELTHLSTRRFGDETTLTSMRGSTVTEIEDVGEPDHLEPYDEATDVPKICGRVIGADVSARYHCVICRGSQQHFNEKSEGHRCERCNMLQSGANFRVVYGGKLSIYHKEQEMSLILTNSAVCAFVADQLAGAAIDGDAIDWKLTCAGNVELEVDANQNVLSIKVAGDDAPGAQPGEESEPSLPGHSEEEDMGQCAGGADFEDDDDLLECDL
ncbi:unnamed protein product [Merluccius merluccius]